MINIKSSEENLLLKKLEEKKAENERPPGANLYPFLCMLIIVMIFEVTRMNFSAIIYDKITGTQHTHIHEHKSSVR